MPIRSPLPACAMMAVAVALSGCTHVRTTQDPSVDLRSFVTYAWSPEPRLLDAEGSESGAPVGERIERAVDAELASRGVRKAPRADAQLLVAATTRTQVKVQNNDPYYALYVAEQYEEG